MDAQLVWDMWRQVLRQDDLVDWVTHSGRNDDPAVSGFSSLEISVLADYACTPQATDTNIGMYRRGLVRNALAALSRVPLSQHLLYRSGLDVEVVAADFARTNGYVDMGPNFWRLAGAFTAYLVMRPEFAAPAHQDVLALDLALVALARRLGAKPVEIWPDTAAIDAGTLSVPDPFSARFMASCAATLSSSRCDLTPWIEDPYGYDPADSPALSPHYWLIYFPTAESEPAYAELSERSARIFSLLSTPMTAAGVTEAYGGLSVSEARSVIDGLAELGVVAGAAE
jgi:hypothetical protein